MDIILEGEPRKLFGLPIAYLLTIITAIGVVGAALIISTTASYTINNNAAFFVYLNDSQVTELQGVGGDLFHLNYTLANKANQDLYYHVTINCSNVEEGDVLLGVDRWNSTSGRVETEDIGLLRGGVHDGKMKVQFNQTFSGNGQCTFGVTQGTFDWG